MSREYYNNPYFVLVFQLLDVIESTFKIGKAACSNKLSDFSSKFWLCYLPRESMFYLRDISKCEHNAEIVLHLYFPHAVSIVWITSRVEGTLQHPRGIWEWATTKIRRCWKKWKRIFLQWPLQNCTWPVWVSSAAAEKQVSRWLLVIFCITQIKTNIWFCFRFTFMLDLGSCVTSMVSDHPLQAGLVTPWCFLLWSLLSAVEIWFWEVSWQSKWKYLPEETASPWLLCCFSLFL